MTRHFPLVISLSALLACLVLSAPAYSQDAEPRSSMVRLSHRFDFEKGMVDRPTFPEGWVLANRSVHPESIPVKLDDAVQFSGKRSLLVKLDGISSIYETALGYRFDPRFSYRLTGFIKTSDLLAKGMRATSARLEIFGFDFIKRTVETETGAIIVDLRNVDVVNTGKAEVKAAFTAGSQKISGTTDWTEGSIAVPRDITRRVRWIKMRCVIEGTDIDGKVWFDNIRFSPVTTIHTSTGRPEGFFSPGRKPAVGIALDTLIEKDYMMTVGLVSPSGERMMTRTFEVTPKTGFLHDSRIPLRFSEFGIYRLDVQVKSADRTAATLRRSVLYCPGVAGGQVSSVWGIYAGKIDRLDEHRTDMLLNSRIGSVAVDLLIHGTEDATAADLGSRAATQFARLRQQKAHPVVVLGALPRKVVNAMFRDRKILVVSHGTWLKVLSLDTKYWLKEFTEAIRPLSSRTQYWQIGHAADHNISAIELTRAVKELRSAITPITYKTYRNIGVVFDGTEPDDILEAASSCDFVVLTWSPRFDVESLSSMITRIRKSVKQVWVSIPVSDVADATAFSADAGAERMILARVAGADRVSVTFLDGGLLDSRGDPRQVTSDVGTVARELAGKKCVGTLRTTRNARMFLFSGENSGTLAIVPHAEASPDVMYVGTNLTMTDLNGNTSAVEMKGDKAVLDARGAPCFVSGIDLEAMRTRLAFSATSAMTGLPELRAEGRAQKIKLSLTNHFAGSITPTLDVIVPPGWKIRPSRFTVRLAPGQSITLDSRLEIPIDEASGTHPLTMKIALRDVNMTVPRLLTVAPHNVTTIVSLDKLKSGRYRVTQEITNTGTRVIRLAAFAFSADIGRMEKFVNGLAPGKSETVSFDLGKPKTQKLWTGWRETSGNRFFNKYFLLPKPSDRD